MWSRLTTRKVRGVIAAAVAASFIGITAATSVDLSTSAPSAPSVGSVTTEHPDPVSTGDGNPWG